MSEIEITNGEEDKCSGNCGDCSCNLETNPLRAYPIWIEWKGKEIPNMVNSEDNSSKGVSISLN